MAIKSAKVDNAAGAGDLLVVAAPGAGRVIRVLNYVLLAAAGVSVKWASGAVSGGAADLTGAMPLSAGQGLWPGWIGDDFHGRACHFETNPNEGLTLNSSAGIQVSGYVNYWVGPAA